MSMWVHYWLLFDVSDGLSNRRLHRYLHGTAWTRGAAVAAEHTLEIPLHSYHFLVYTSEQTNELHHHHHHYVFIAYIATSKQ